MNIIIYGLIINLMVSLLISLVYIYFYRQYRDRFIMLWSLGWVFLSTALAFNLWAYIIQQPMVRVIGTGLPGILFAYFIIWGSYNFLKKNLSKFWLFSLIAATTWTCAGVLLKQSQLVIIFPAFFFISAALARTGYVYIRSGDLHGVGGHITGWSLILMAIHEINFPILNSSVLFAPWGFIIGLMLKLSIAFGLLLVYIQKTRRDLVQSEENFRLLAENAKDLIFRIRLNPEKNFQYVSPAVTTITGFKPEEFYKNPKLVIKMIQPKDRELILNSLMDPINTLTVKCFRKDGKSIWLESLITPIWGKKGELTAIEGVARDITDRKEMEEQLKIQSLYDPITGLKYRTFFEQKMRFYAKSDVHPLGIIICDLDGLKIVNDTLGQTGLMN